MLSEADRAVTDALGMMSARGPLLLAAALIAARRSVAIGGGPDTAPAL
jgi:hypothetical protein